jgi:hypothetical protein
VDAGAVDADEDAICDARPGRVLGVAVETNLKTAQFEL